MFEVDDLNAMAPWRELQFPEEKFIVEYKNDQLEYGPIITAFRDGAFDVI